MSENEFENKGFFLDQQDFLAKFLLNPEIVDEADFSHIDKNLSVTRLVSRYNEPEQARSILRSLHVFNNTNYFKKVIEDVSTGEFKTITLYDYSCPVCGEERYSENNLGTIKCCDKDLNPEVVNREIPITHKVIKMKSLFPRTYHNLKALFYAFTTTSMARDGHLIKSATTTNLNKTESVEDKTRVRGNPFFGKNNNSFSGEN